MRGLDWFNFFLADIQTGFGPFVAVYSARRRSRSQGDIGLVLTVGALVALVGQIPGGALVDATRSTRLIATVAIAGISASAIAIAGWPIFFVVLGARVVHATASCILGPTIAALGLGLVGHAALGERLGRNARYASIGAESPRSPWARPGHFHSNQAVLVCFRLQMLRQCRPLQRLLRSDPQNLFPRLDPPWLGLQGMASVRS